MKLWKTRTTENTMKKPILPRKEADYFRIIEWWMKPGRQNLYKGLQRVAVSYLVVHASSARTERNLSWAGIVATSRRNRLSPEALGWLVFLKRNSRFMPTKEEMATEYLRRHRKRAHECT